MQVHRDINNLPKFKNAVITIGTFDGVHTGHLQIFNLLKKEAHDINGETVIITFHPHPRMIVQRVNEQQNAEIRKIHLLNTPEEKISLIEKQNIDHLVIVPFTQAFSLLTAEEYIKDFLAAKFHPHTIIIGYDHHFGTQRKGNYKLLEEYAPLYSYIVKEIPEHVINNMAISSTKIREALACGDVDTANKFSGYDYFFEGTVVEGDKIGRTIGYPTANLLINNTDKLVPCDGIYAVELLIKDDNNIAHPTSNTAHLKGMMSIGYRPTVGGTERKIEVNIFDFNKDIYGQTIRVYIKKYLREEKKFDGLPELKDAIANDKIETLKYFSEL